MLFDQGSFSEVSIALIVPYKCYRSLQGSNMTIASVENRYVMHICYVSMYRRNSSGIIYSLLSSTRMTFLHETEKVTFSKLLQLMMTAAYKLQTRTNKDTMKINSHVCVMIRTTVVIDL